MIVSRVVALTLVGAIAGCASGLNSMQKREYAAFEQANVLIKEKSPTAGLVLGLLPGGGSFYAREPALGVLNLLLWPASILWDPFSGQDGAMAINYDVTKHHLKRQADKEISELDYKLGAGRIDAAQYALEKRKVERNYDFE